MIEQLFTLCGVEKEQIEGVVLASVVPQLTHALMGALSFVTGKRPLNVSSGVKTGLNIRSDQPQQVGADRVTAAVAAKARGKLPCVVVDCGAAITFTVLDQSGALAASAIAPGVRMSLEALRAESAPAAHGCAGEQCQIRHDGAQHRGRDARGRGGRRGGR